MDSYPVDVQQAVAAWVMGDCDDGDTIAALCAVVAERSVFCGLFGAGATHVAGSFGVETEVAARAAAMTVSTRALLSRQDERWAHLALDADSEYLTWIVCEPVVAGTTSATLVVLGAAESVIDDVLVLVPAVAKAIAPVVARQRVTAASRDLRHQFNNELAALVANVEYAFDLVSTLHEATQPDRIEMAAALNNAKNAARRVSAHARTLTRLFDPEVSPRQVKSAPSADCVRE